MKVERNQQALLLEIMELQFAAIDLNLFLDTHPDEMQALVLFDQINQQLEMAVSNYERMYGPLTASGQIPGRNRWDWVEGPWPWEMTF
jgi:spore coat protein JB